VLSTYLRRKERKRRPGQGVSLDQAEGNADGVKPSAGVTLQVEYSTR